MSDVDQADLPPDTDRQATPSANPLKRNPRLQIWLIAAVFYAILAGMCMFVLVLIVRG